MQIHRQAALKSHRTRNTYVSRRTVALHATGGRTNARTAKLRQLLSSPGILKGPCCHDALSARLIEQAGFEFAFMSGFCTSAAKLGAPDTGLLSYGEMVEQGRYIHEATRTLPVIGDGDNGYGNAMNVKRTVRGYADAGFAGILIEDQIWPKSCGHVRGKRVTDRGEAVMRVRAAVDAREEGADILVVARTDARQAVSLDEALWRVAAFVEAGADVVFVDALESEAEMQALCAVAPGVPKMANMLEGGGKTPILAPEALQEIGYKLVAYPLSLLGVSIRAMEGALEGLKAGRVPDVRSMGSFLDIQRAVGFPEYFEEETRYAVSAASSSNTGSGGAATASRSGASADEGEVVQVSFEEADERQKPAGSSSWAGPDIVEADEIILEDLRSAVGGNAAAEQRLARLGSSYGAGGGGARDARGRSQSLRVVILDPVSNTFKLERKIPLDFLAGITMLVPQLKGINLEAIVQQALGGDQDLTKPIYSFAVDANMTVQVFLESSDA